MLASLYLLLTLSPPQPSWLDQAPRRCTGIYEQLWHALDSRDEDEYYIAWNELVIACEGAFAGSWKTVDRDQLRRDLEVWRRCELDVDNSASHEVCELAPSCRSPELHARLLDLDLSLPPTCSDVPTQCERSLAASEGDCWTRLERVEATCGRLDVEAWRRDSSCSAELQACEDARARLDAGEDPTSCEADYARVEDSCRARDVPTNPCSSTHTCRGVIDAVEAGQCRVAIREGDACLGTPGLGLLQDAEATCRASRRKKVVVGLGTTSGILTLGGAGLALGALEGALNNGGRSHQQSMTNGIVAGTVIAGVGLTLLIPTVITAARGRANEGRRTTRKRRAARVVRDLGLTLLGQPFSF